MNKQRKSFEATALLALPKVAAGNSPEKGLLSWSRPFLIDKVRASGRVDVVVTRGFESLDEEQGVARSVTRPEYDNDGNVTLSDMGDVALGSFSIMRTITKSVDVDHLVSVLNPSGFRQHARNKDQAAVDLLEPAGAYDRQYASIQPGEHDDSITDKLDALEGSLFVAKPNIGRRSGGITVGDRDAMREKLAGQTVSYLVEEKLDFSAPMPGIKGLNEVQQARLDEANRLGVNKELRMYYFGEGVWDSVARVAKVGETDFRTDKWLYIQPDSIPEEVWIKSAGVIEQIKKRIGTDEVNIALDWVYASSASQQEPHWQVMEINVGEPQLIQVHEHREIGERQHTKLATQIERIAVS